MASPELPYCTCRFSNLPTYLDDALLRAAVITLGKDQKVLFSSLAADYRKPSGTSLIGTITWNTVPSQLRGRDLETGFTWIVPENPPHVFDDTSEDVSAKNREVTIDTHFRGFTPLNAGPVTEDKAVDVVCMTGVGGRPFMSWQHSSGAMWLRDFLPRDISIIQVFTYGYPSKLRQSDSVARLLHYTNVFLEDLRSLSQRNPLAPRPLILIGHSYGGLIIKQAIIEAAADPKRYCKLSNSIHSIVLIGVPHRGMNTAALEEMVIEEPTKGLIEELKEGSTLIRSLNENFSKHTKHLKILTCYELEKTGTMERTDDGWKRTGPKEMMVDETSACLYYDNEARLPFQLNHSMIAKLSDDPWSEYHRIKDHLVSYTGNASDVIQSRLKKQECAAALSEMYQLVDFVYGLVSKIKIDKSEASEFKTQIVEELSILEAFSNFMVDDELQKLLDDDELSARYPQRITNLLQKLKGSLSSFTSLAMKYYEPYQKALRLGVYLDFHEDVERDSSSRKAIAISDKILQDQELNKELFLKSSLDTILQQCNRATTGLRETMTLVLLHSMSSSTVEESSMLQQKVSIRRMNLAPTVKRQSLVRSAGKRAQEPLQGRLEMIPTPAGKGAPELQLGYFHRAGNVEREAVILEYRRYEPDLHVEVSDQKPPLGQFALAHTSYLNSVKVMMRNLAGVLHDLSHTDEEDIDRSSRSMNYFHCLGFLEQSERFRYAFLFKTPRGLSFESVMDLMSLSTYLINAKSGKKLPLEEKMHLAYDFCQAVLDLHSYGWVHKNIRSDNVMLLPRTGDIDGYFAEGAGLPQRFVPYLKGFEYSRPGHAKSSGRANFEPATKFYRHPARQDIPDETFTKEHDLYAVGVVLLEIGLQKTMTTIYGNEIKRARQGHSFPSPDEVRDGLMELARSKLPEPMGTRYAEAVQMCIGGFGITEDNKEQTKLSLAFRQQVLDLLEARLGS